MGEAMKSIAPRGRATAAMVCSWRAREIGTLGIPQCVGPNFARWRGPCPPGSNARDRALADRELYPHAREIAGAPIRNQHEARGGACLAHDFEEAPDRV